VTEASELIVRADMPLPPSVPAGRGSAVLCIGACFHPREPIQELELLVDGRPHRPAAWRMPRLDLVRALPPDAGNPYRSGFWAVLPLEPRARPGTVRVDLAARLESGPTQVAPFGEIEVVAAPPPAPERRAATGRIAVCMATFEPDMELFTAQLESLRGQTDERWACVISDDCSSEASFDAIRAAVESDERFELSRSTERLGPYRNFERALGLAPADAELVALCDQDDRWHPEKLATLRAALGPAQLVYSDQRVLARDGRVVRESLWTGRRNEHSNIASLLVANAIAGAATMFRREVAELALPFPEAPGWQFHDHWIALVALASGDVEYVDRPLYDYVQHEGAVVGQAAGTTRANAGAPGSRGWRAAYFYGYLPRLVQAETLLARCSERLSARKRRALRRFAAADRGRLALAWLAARPLRRLAGRGETLGTEAELAKGIFWRHLVRARAGRRERPDGSPYDASCPPLDAGTLGHERLGRWLAGG
jgi:glycosyltransferase involved in cell wall biosynthesis